MNDIVLISGGFDPIHSGHIALIQEAAKFGDVIVLLNSDEWLRNKKGKEFIDRLPKETKDFIIRVLSRETLMRNDMVTYEKQPLFSVMIADAEDHIIREGETLYDIVGEYDTNLEDLLELNPIKNPNKVKPGQKIKVKR